MTPHHHILHVQHLRLGVVIIHVPRPEHSVDVHVVVQQRRLGMIVPLLLELSPLIVGVVTGGLLAHVQAVSRFVQILDRLETLSRLEVLHGTWSSRAASL